MTRVCYRDAESGRLDSEGYDACRGGIEDICSAGSYPPGCMPNQGAADTCYSALIDDSHFHVVATLSMPALPECEAICGGLESGGI